MTTFQFAVQFAADHAAMAAGVFGTTFVTVQADDATQASLLAAQMAGRHGIPTAVSPI